MALALALFSLYQSKSEAGTRSSVLVETMQADIRELRADVSGCKQ